MKLKPVFLALLVVTHETSFEARFTTDFFVTFLICHSISGTIELKKETLQKAISYANLPTK